MGCTVSALKDKGRTPFLIVNIDGSAKQSVLFYGHMDKQPFGDGWRTSPTDPVIEGGKLYGRGSSDDCYALYSAVLAVKACQAQGLPHPRVVITIEASEEGGDTDDLVYYMRTYKDSHIGQVDAIVCLDTSAFVQETLVVSSSLRGGFPFNLRVAVADENMHSGYSGIVPDPYLVALSLLQRVCNFETHEVISEFEVEIPSHRLAECH